MINFKSVSQRAAEAVKSKASSAELLKMRTEVTRRIEEVDHELKAKQAEADAAIGTGDPEVLKAVRQSEAELKDEDLMLHRQQSDLHRAYGLARGNEAMKSAGQHRKNLEAALKRAEEAHATLVECERVAREVVRARADAAAIGETLVFDLATIRALAAAVLPEGNQRKQLKIDLGIIEARRAA